MNSIKFENNIYIIFIIMKYLFKLPTYVLFDSEPI